MVLQRIVRQITPKRLWYVFILLVDIVYRDLTFWLNYITAADLRGGDDGNSCNDLCFIGNLFCGTQCVGNHF